MRKLFAVVLSGLIVAGLPGMAAAGKTKTLKKRVTFTAPVPAPIYSDIDPKGCVWDGSVEDVSKDTYSFTTPKHRGKGTLSFRIDGFTGDWDLFVFDKDGDLLTSSTSDNSMGAYEQVSGLKLKKKTTVDIVACNWQSETPSVNGYLAYKYRK